MSTPDRDQPLKSLPRFKKVLKPPGPVSNEIKVDSEPVHKRTESKTPLAEPISSSGRYSSTANDVDDSAMDAQLRLFSSSAARKTDALHARPSHTKPKFVQIVTSSRSKNDDPDAEKLLDYLKQDFNGDLEDDDSLNEGPLEIEGLVPKLLPHQQEGVRFLSRRETSRGQVKGALLGDAMGLGKTVQSIALMLLNKPDKSEPFRTTLIVVPLAVLNQWKTELNNMAPTLSVTTHQGPKRTKKVSELTKHDAVITTYDTVKSELKNCEKAPLYQTSWWRVIADEAHSFRNTESKVWEAMTELSTGRRLALTGTPVHNSPVDLYALLYFLKVPRYCKVEDTSKEGFLRAICPKVDSEIRRELEMFMIRRSQKVIDAIMPPLERTVRAMRLSQLEMLTYAHITQKRRANMTLLRQACCGMTQSESQEMSRKMSEGQFDTDNESPTAARESDVGNQLEIKSESDPLVDMLAKLNIDKQKPDFEYPFHTNSKVKEVRELILAKRQRKTVIFSSFLGMLHMLSLMLKHEGIGEQLYYGKMTSQERTEALQRFSDPKKNVTVLLCSLQTAAVGLNLTSASQVVIADPWYNPQIVDQAVMRVHRLGQKEPVLCVELYVEGLIEDRILELQRRKREMARSLLDVSDKLTKKEQDWLSHEDSAKMKAIIARGLESTKTPKEPDVKEQPSKSDKSVTCP